MKLAFAPLVLVAGALALSEPALAADYVIDTKGNHASVNFRIKHLGFSWLTGRFDRFSGTFSYDKDKPDASKVKVEIDTTSFNSNHAERDKHIKSADFLDAGKFPTATFESTAVKPNGDGKATITGKLTLHGVTKEIAIEAGHVGGGDDPWGGFRDGFTGTTTLTLADFGIDPAKHLGPSAANVELTLNVEGVRQ
jgi:polyisoprenoid-binding protein YceI